MNTPLEANKKPLEAREGTDRHWHPCNLDSPWWPWPPVRGW